MCDFRFTGPCELLPTDLTHVRSLAEVNTVVNCQTTQPEQMSFHSHHSGTAAPRCASDDGLPGYLTYLWSIHTTRTCASRSCPSGRGIASYVCSDDPVPDMRSCNGYSEPLPPPVKRTGTVCYHMTRIISSSYHIL